METYTCYLLSKNGICIFKIEFTSFESLVLLPEGHGEDFHGCICEEVPAGSL